MKKNNSAKRGQQDGTQQPGPPEKVGWVRKYCGKGIFREIWKARYVVLRGDQLLLSEKEVKDDKAMQEMFDLSDYERCEELRKSKSRSKKNHSKFTLAHCRQPGNTAPNLIFLAVSPEEKESWINALSSAIARAKNRILDEVTVEEESFLAHPTRDRAKIQHSRRPPTRGHLMAVASTSTSDGMLTLELIQEEEGCAQERSSCQESFRVDLAKSAAQLSAARRRPPAAPRPPAGDPGPPQHRLQPGAVYTPQAPKRLCPSQKGRCASLEEILARRDPAPPRGALGRGLGAAAAPLPPEPEQLSRIQQLVALKLAKTQELLAEVKGYGEGRGKPKETSTTTSTTSTTTSSTTTTTSTTSCPSSSSSSSSSSKSDSERILQESERLLGEASSTWSQAKRVLQEVKELRDLYRQLELQQADSRGRHSSQPHFRKSLM